MKSGFVNTVIEVTSSEKFKGDILIASLWNGASAVMGRKDLPSRYKGYRTEDLMKDVEVILSRPRYMNNKTFQSLRFFGTK